MNNDNPQPAIQFGQIGPLLAQIESLPSGEQRRLYAVLGALLGEPHTQNLASSQSVSAEEPESDVSEMAQVRAWYEGLGEITEYERVTFIDGALQEVGAEEARVYLLARRKEVLDEKPAVSVRVAVTRMAAEQPLLVIGAVAGVLLGILSLGGGLLRVWF